MFSKLFSEAFIDGFFTDFDEIIKEINTIENNGDRILREALVEIVAHKDDIFNLIRWKEILTRLFFSG